MLNLHRIVTFETHKYTPMSYSVYSVEEPGFPWAVFTLPDVLLFKVVNNYETKCRGDLLAGQVLSLN